MIVIRTLNDCELRYSDLGVKIRQVETDTLWNDAINEIPCHFTYEETDIPIDDDPLEAQEALDVIFGGSQ